jgi:PAS domain S-box-containing protein
MNLDPRYFPLILDVLDQGVFTVDKSTVITSFNQAAERITGYSATEVLGRCCSEIFRTLMCETGCPLRQSILTREPNKQKGIYIQSRSGRYVPLSVSTAPLLTLEGELLGGVEIFQDMSSMVDLEKRLENRFHVLDVIGRSRAMQELFKIMPMLADTISTVLITGASGTGKELVARTIHAMSCRREKPFIAINCAAIPETLLESELFGHSRGAYTDARQDRLGRIAAAEKGTLFLDEIGDLPKPMQVKLLRFLQEHTYEPLGANRTVRADVRVMAASHRKLDEMVASGEFREDLYYRLNVIQLHMPTLWERMEDVPLLLDHLLAVFRQRTGKDIQGFNQEAMSAIFAYAWPGNVRELENMVERAFILCNENHIGPQHLPPCLLGKEEAGAIQSWSGPGKGDPSQEIREALARHGGNRSHAAKELRIHRITLLRRMHRLGIS